MTYVFHVRDWNVDFFLALEKEIIKSNTDANIIWLTMIKVSYNRLLSENKNVYYLPQEFQNFQVAESKARTELELWLNNTYNFGINYLFEMERFKPTSKYSDPFINAHVEVLYKLIPENSRIVACTLDHFVYFISAYINKLKGGTNYFIQTIGMPLNAQVILDTLHEKNNFRKVPLSENYLDDYIESLNKSPKESVYYMKEKKQIPLFETFKIRFNDLFTKNDRNTVFNYLDSKPKNIIPSRFKKKRINFNLNHLSYTDLKGLSNKIKIFYFPLHAEPEMSILGYSPYYTNQLEIIRIISMSLKNNDILVLKENPVMVGIRKEDFYKEISFKRNVYWANHDENSREIIRLSFKVIAISGTATIEAACLGINSILFGKPPFYKILIESPVDEKKASDIHNVLYKKYTSEEIIKNVYNNWQEFSKSIFFGIFTPQYINYKHTLANSQELAVSFINEVLNN